MVFRLSRTPLASSFGCACLWKLPTCQLDARAFPRSASGWGCLPAPERLPGSGLSAQLLNPQRAGEVFPCCPPAVFVLPTRTEPPAQGSRCHPERPRARATPTPRTVSLESVERALPRGSPLARLKQQARRQRPEALGMFPHHRALQKPLLKELLGPARRLQPVEETQPAAPIDEAFRHLVCAPPAEECSAQAAYPLQAAAVPAKRPPALSLLPKEAFAVPAADRPPAQRPLAVPLPQ
ncbi:hypothetical protein HRbin16_02647 [bacterium HR16]|nr:hypothetical protein HRbin16_02647 [bacterium HR16]